MSPQWRQFRQDSGDYDGGMATSIDQSNFIKTALRLPPELHAKVHESAKASGRSYNAELISLLEKALVVPDGYIPAPRIVRSFDATGEMTERTPKELFSELAQSLQHAFVLAQLFRQYEDGEPTSDISGGPPAWHDRPGTVGGEAAAPMKRVAKKKKR